MVLFTGTVNSWQAPKLLLTYIWAMTFQPLITSGRLLHPSRWNGLVLARLKWPCEFLERTHVPQPTTIEQHSIWVRGAPLALGSMLDLSPTTIYGTSKLVTGVHFEQLGGIEHRLIPLVSYQWNPFISLRLCLDIPHLIDQSR